MPLNRYKDFSQLPALYRFCIHFSTLGPIGYNPYAPGTSGALTATVLAPLLFTPLSLYSRVLLLLIIFFAGAFTSNFSERYFQKKDPSAVVIDELGGQLLSFLPLDKTNIILLLLDFLSFRIFDILKPWPVKRSENWLPKGFGIMLDDYLAGILSALVLSFIAYLASW